MIVVEANTSQHMVHGTEIIRWSSLLLCQSQTTHVVSDINHASVQPQRFVHSSLPSSPFSRLCFLSKVLSGPNKGSLDLLWNIVFASALHNHSDSHTYDASVRKYLPHFYSCSPSAFIWIILVSLQSENIHTVVVAHAMFIDQLVVLLSVLVCIYLLQNVSL
jgi:hypothetical protein